MLPLPTAPSAASRRRSTRVSANCLSNCSSDVGNSQARHTQAGLANPYLSKTPWYFLAPSNSTYDFALRSQLDRMEEHYASPDSLAGDRMTTHREVLTVGPVPAANEQQQRGETQTGQRFDTRAQRVKS